MATAWAHILITSYGEYKFPPAAWALATNARRRKNGEVDMRTREGRRLDSWCNAQLRANNAAPDPYDWRPADID